MESPFWVVERWNITGIEYLQTFKAGGSDQVTVKWTRNLDEAWKFLAADDIVMFLQAPGTMQYLENDVREGKKAFDHPLYVSVENSVRAEDKQKAFDRLLKTIGKAK